MILENGTRHDFKQCALQTATVLPVEGYTYEIPGWSKLVAVLAVDRHWVHIVTLDLYTATSHDLEAWLQHAAEGLIHRTDAPWRDLSDVRKTMFI